jgi:hypothetical protein
MYIFVGLECVGHSCAYVALFMIFLRDVWIRTQSAAVAVKSGCFMQAHRVGKGRAEIAGISRPLSWSVHHNLAGEGYIESTCCFVKARFLGMQTKKLFSL